MKVSTVFQAVAGTALSTGLFVGVGAAQAQDKVSDAQVEANVLKALAGTPELSTQNIQTSTIYGTVTISGNVHDEALRSKTENLVARVSGVKKVVDELELGDEPASNDANAPETANMAPDPGQPPLDAQGQPLEQQPDGSYAPPPPSEQQDGMAPPPEQQGMNQAPPPPDNGYGQPPSQRQPMYQQGPPPQGYGPPPQGGQRGGIPVTVPPGALLRVRINRGIDSQHIQPGTPFDAMVLSDIVAGGAVAIPRGATVTGVVVDAEKTKALSGRGKLALQITGLQLGGQVFPIQSDVWQYVGADKTSSTVNHAVGLGILGAVIGGVAGGGAGAAIGAGVGAGAGVAASAGGPRGRVLVAPESVLVFHTAAPTQVRTVGQQELERLSYNAGPQQGAPRRYYHRPGYYPY
jgi:hypothetical protein